MDSDGTNSSSRVNPKCRGPVEAISRRSPRISTPVPCTASISHSAAGSVVSRSQFRRVAAVDSSGIGGRDCEHGQRLRSADLARRQNLKPHATGERRQRLRWRRQARTAECVAPIGALGEIANQTVTCGVAGVQRAGEPDKRMRIAIAKTDRPACTRQAGNRSPIQVGVVEGLSATVYKVWSNADVRT